MTRREHHSSPPEKDRDGFVGRWSRRKLESGATSKDLSQPVPEPVEPPPCDEDMPPISALDENSDYSGFLSERVSETLRRQALRKLFHSPLLNVCDGLDDYAEDFTSFAALGDIITADMRHQVALAEEREARAGEEGHSRDPLEDAPSAAEEEERVASAQAQESGADDIGQLPQGQVEDGIDEEEV